MTTANQPPIDPAGPDPHALAGTPPALEVEEQRADEAPPLPPPPPPPVSKLAAAAMAVAVVALLAAGFGWWQSDKKVSKVDTFYGGKVTDLLAADAAQAGRLAALEEADAAQVVRISALESTDAAQVVRISALESTDLAQAGRLAVVERKTGLTDRKVGRLGWRLGKAESAISNFALSHGAYERRLEALEAHPLPAPAAPPPVSSIVCPPGQTAGALGCVTVEVTVAD